MMEPHRRKGESFGSFFKRLRESRGFASQRELACKSGVSNVTISRIENGSARPTPDTLRKFAPVLQVSYVDLMKSAGFLPYNYEPSQDFNDDEENIIPQDSLSKDDIKILEQLVRQLKYRNRQKGWY